MRDPNLAQRYRQYFSYLVRRYAWGLKRSGILPNGGGALLVPLLRKHVLRLSPLYSIRILLFLNSRLPEALFILVPILALSGIVAWLLVRSQVSPLPGDQ